MEKPGAKLTIIDIARLSGVSKSTVSRVLSGRSNVSGKARERVLEVVQSSGFRRNELARSLRSGRTGMIGLLIPDISNPFWADVARGVQDSAETDDMSLLIFSSDWDPDREHRHFSALTQSRVDGVIVNPVSDKVDELSRFEIPAVVVGSASERFPNLPSIGSDIRQVVEIGVERLIASGLDMPALLVGEKDRAARARFVQAVCDVGTKAGWPVEKLRMENGHYTVEGGRLAMQRLLQDAVPRAVFAANDLMALGALQTLRAAGLHCPNDVALLGTDGILAAEVSSPALTTIAKPARELGRRAFQLLKQQTVQSGSIEHQFIEAELVERETLPRARSLNVASVG